MFDHSRRDENVLFQPDSNLYDVELQHELAQRGHQVVWGAGYRHARDQVEDGVLVGFPANSRGLNWVKHRAGQRASARHAGAQGRHQVRAERLFGVEKYCPPCASAGHRPRVAFIWGGASRAVRAPAHLDREILSPIGGNILGGPEFESEVADNQVGYRSQVGDVVTWSATGYLHEWDKLRSGSAPPS